MLEKSIQEKIKDQNVLITGGTGSFGSAITKSLLKLQPKKIHIISRDELKQHNLKNNLKDPDNLIEYHIGDVRDLDSMIQATRNIDIIFHAAAMKHVPICEREPMEAVKTNVIGAYNLKEAAIRNNVKQVVAISTDKAVRSINVMGMTKAIQERILLADGKNNNTKFTCVRFGNVIGSSGSAIPLFKSCIEKNEPIPLTDEAMTRFFMTLEDSMKLIYTALLQGEHGQIFVQKMPTAKTIDIIKVLIKHCAKDPNHPIKTIGIREGEQLYEALISDEEMQRVREFEAFYIIYPYGYLSKAEVLQNIEAYKSNLTENNMSLEEIESQLKQAGVI